MKRAVAVAAHERHGEEIEEASEVALDPVAGAPMLAGPVVDGELGHAEALVVREHRDVAVELSVDAQAAHDFGSIGLEAAVQIVHPEP